MTVKQKERRLYTSENNFYLYMHASLFSEYSENTYIEMSLKYINLKWWNIFIMPIVNVPTTEYFRNFHVCKASN